ncbi:MAG: indolepyruvate ferredoxin oxidoreductase subunit alpha [Treponema sp.]|nr:indolepyruvate ferredoxin oxidoreductase subunit alpha [Treponema sp.]
MNQLLLGNAAVARGLFESGCEIVSSYPGTPSTEITEEAAKFTEIYCEWAPNEKVAMETVFGSALAGKRSFCGMKHVGLNVAADPLYTASYSGVNAGLVVGVADDPAMHSSQNEQDSRHHAIASKIPMIEPSDSQECIDFMKIAFEMSEKFDTPVLFKMCTRIAHSQSIAELGQRKCQPVKAYEKNIQKNVMTPANAIRKHPIVEERNKKIADWSINSGLNKVELSEKSKIGVITSSTSYQYTKEVFADKISILKLGLVNPLPEKMIRDFASKVQMLIIIEELDPIIENFCRSLNLPNEIHGKDLLPICGEYSQNLLKKCLKNLLPADFIEDAPETKKLIDNIPVRPPIMCAGCPHRGIFYELSKMKLNVMGDIGCYTLGAAAPLFAMDMNLCMGASVSSLHGWNKALPEHEKNSVAVIGDSTFVHSGITGLASIAYNQSNSTVIVLDNSITGMTGHQQNPTTGKNLYGDPAGKVDLEALARAMGINRVKVIDPYNLAQCEEVLKEELAAPEVSLIISRRPCALLKEVKHNPPLKVNADKCKSCKMCMKIGCPAISMKVGKAAVDSTLCVGCGLCTQMCKFDAFESTAN